MTTQLIYGDDGALRCVAITDDSGMVTCISPNGYGWNDYVAKFGVPPMTGTPSFPPAPVPQNVKNAVTFLKNYAASPVGASTGISAQQDLFNRAVLLALQQIWQSLN